MKDINQVAVILRTLEIVWEGLRSALGLAIENKQVDVYLVGVSISIADQEKDWAEKFEMLDDLEGRAFTNVPENAGLNIRFISLAEVSSAIAGYDLVIAL